jgi:hypothetical protein
MQKKGGNQPPGEYIDKCNVEQIYKRYSHRRARYSQDLHKKIACRAEERDRRVRCHADKQQIARDFRVEEVCSRRVKSFVFHN